MASALLSDTVQRLQASAGEQGEGSTILQHISTLEVGQEGREQGWVGLRLNWVEHWALEENWLDAGSKFVFLWLATS